jgi:hypothetical protein
MITRKHLKKVLSTVGATVLLGTFLAKETRKDQLKELIDSIDTAETSYIMRVENRRTFAELTRFEQSFNKFKQNPTKPQHDDFGGGSGDSSWPAQGEIDNDVFKSVVEDWGENEQVLDNVNRLAAKLPQSSALDLIAIRDEDNKVSSELATLAVETGNFERNPGMSSKERSANADTLNKRIYAAAGAMEPIDSGTKKISQKILDMAEAERQSDEHKYKIWSVGFYVLYFLGWSIGVAGILLGDDEKDDNPIEELAG